MQAHYPHLFSPIQIGGKWVKNRISCSPQSIAGSHDANGLTRRGFDYYLQKARGGAGIVTLGETQVLSDFFQNPNADEITKYRLLTEMIHNYGALASIELGHRGCEDYVFEPGGHVEGPSGGIKPSGVIIDEISPDRMEELAAAYAKACRLCLDCGFDMVMIHGGHSWLLAQFLSPLFNKRTDEYGGSLENRARFPLMVLRRIRDEVGHQLLLDYRLSAEEVVEGGLHLDEAVEFCQMIQPYVDLIHASVGTHVDPWCYTFTSIYHKNGINLPLAQAIKQAVQVPVVAIGGFNDPEQCEQAIASGQADIICLGRQMLADPAFPAKAQQGMPEEINPCIRCMGCHSAPPPPTYCNCTVNPMGGKEYLARPAPQLWGLVVVVGGGPAGMTAASRAADCGARVILLEQSDHLGGMLEFSDHDVWKGDVKRLKDHLIARTLNRDIQVQFNTAATPDLLERLAPDYVICAVGAQPARPPIPGIETAVSAVDAYKLPPESLGRRIVIVGGGLVGCELAMHLSVFHKELTVVEQGAELAPEGYRMHRGWLLQRLELAAQYRTDTRCVEITGGGIWVEDNQGRHFLAADTVIYALGMRSRTDTADELRTAAPKGFIAVGDCVTPGKLKEAIHQGYFAIDLMAGSGSS